MKNSIRTQYLIPTLDTPGPGLLPDEVPEDIPVGFRVDERNFPDVLEIIRQGNYHQVMRLNFVELGF